jgi:hypothetical protein
VERDRLDVEVVRKFSECIKILSDIATHALERNISDVKFVIKDFLEI